MTKVKRLLQSVEEASSAQVAADLGVEYEIAAATLEHLRTMGKVVCRRPGSDLPPTPDACRERVSCASCPLVPVCDPQATTISHRKEGSVYAWAAN